MAPVPYFFKETRISLEPSTTAYSVDIKLPTSNSQGWSQRQPAKSAKAAARNDASRATASAIYYRKYHSFPRAFLWRVLGGDNTILSIRTADIYKPKKASDANLILNFHFYHPIRPTCIALSDAPDHDAVSVFVLDTANQLYTLFLRPDSFRKRSFVETGLGDACRIYQPNAFRNFKHPYRLIAVNSDQLVVTTSDGGHVRYDRNTTHNVSHPPWKETFYNAKGWFRSILGGRGDMDIKAAASAVHTDLGLDDASFLFTVCLDHHLRVWNLNSGQILGTMDLLDAERDPQETGKWQLDASQTNLMQIAGSIEGKRLCVTYSPIGSGEFKFWLLQSNHANSVDVTVTFSTERFIPTPPLGSDVWTLADFRVIECSPSDGYRLWLLWKNNMAYRVQELSFKADNLPEAWQHGWRSVFSDTVIPTAQASSPSDPVDPTERWLQLILFPGRFPRATIEAAIAAYEGVVGRQGGGSSRNGQGLAESICSAIAATASLNKTSSGDMEHEQFRASSETQWRKFYRILLELDKPRGEALTLSYESESGIPWVVCADSISAIRECSELEQICHNPTSRFQGSNEGPSLITSGLNFLDSFSDSMLQICRSVLRSEMFEESPKTDQERIQFFSDKAGFWRQISDEDCAQVTDVLGPNFNLVTTNLYERLLEVCDETWDAEHPTEHPLTEFGRRIIVRAVQDMAELQWNVCFSQLILLVHMEFEFDRPEDALHNRVEIGVVYRNLLTYLRRLELVRWLANTQISAPLPKADRPSSVSGNSPVAPKRQVDDHRVITALEGNVGHLLGLPELDSAVSETMPAIITSIVVDLCAPSSNIELQPQYIQCGLLVRDRPDLAAELNPFCKEDPFSTYVQGRVHLALKDYTSASTYFKKAAYGMSVPQAEPDKHSSGLLDETEWNLLFAGLPRYYAHIVALFEQHKAYSYVIDFSRLALQFVNSRTEDAEKARTEIQCRLFSGAIATSQFELAHATLVAMKDRALQMSCLRALIQRMCDNLHNAEFVALPFPGLQGAVDDVLAQHCRDAADVVTGVPYHQILYAWRVRRNDYRGAAAVLLDRIHKLRQLGEGDQVAGDDMLDTAVTRQYLMLINVLSCVEPKQAWITTEAGGSARTAIVAAAAAAANAKDAKDDAAAAAAAAAAAPVVEKRKVVTLADIRKEYQDELDRIAAIHNNQFGFAADDEMEIL
ncbi:nucleoporin Nup120/160-domain-containing protein [Durotheca rogersii]|uniref:nucleoporin Nup120/160-domain-containing protein n=1 Tax=Durotheca rogersii TaxID=419775 RepID=UPI00221F508A|nr:nucleoporin Nup120/160-domain-containing protein [Durotheca rogersii]KAI5865037.1 nucleoporin Nup120/160-domain-containing protein [Durotheca rogersii]